MSSMPNTIMAFAAITFFTLVLAGTAMAEPAKGMRYKTLADVMDETMRTKDLAWLTKNLGKPEETDTQYPGHTVLRWKARNETADCKQAFAISSDNTIVGWSSNCPAGLGNKAYGEVSATTPIPKPVFPEAIARAIQERQGQTDAESRATRKGTFADLLHSYMGKSEEEVYVDHKRLSSSETLHSGKVVKTYSRSYIKVHGFDEVKYTCQYSFSFLKGNVVGYDAGNCDDNILVKNYTVPYSTPSAKWSAL